MIETWYIIHPCYNSHCLHVTFSIECSNSFLKSCSVLAPNIYLFGEWDQIMIDTRFCFRSKYRDFPAYTVPLTYQAELIIVSKLRISGNILSEKDELLFCSQLCDLVNWAQVLIMLLTSAWEFESFVDMRMI